MRRVIFLVPVFLGITIENGVAQSAAPTPTEQHQAKQGSVMTKKSRPLVTDEIRLVDGSGRTRLLLSTRSGLPVIQLLRADGSLGLSATLDASGRGSVRIQGSDPSGPSASLEVDDKGSHVKFDRSGGASSYLFLNNAGESGVVLLDLNGKRRLNLLVQADGEPVVQRFNTQGQPIP